MYAIRSYYGEPLLAMEKIKQVKKIIDQACCPMPVSYMLYTNSYNFV